jgi:hypothetical protein
MSQKVRDSGWSKGQLGMKIASCASVTMPPFENFMNVKGSGNWVFTVCTANLSIVAKLGFHMGTYFL